jgi:hypothetical protein
MRTTLVGLALLAVGCTRPNPEAVVSAPVPHDLSAEALDGGAHDLRGADLTGVAPADLAGADFAGADFAGVDLAATADDLAGADLAASDGAIDLRPAPDLNTSDGPGTCAPPTLPLTRFVKPGVALTGAGALTVALPDGYLLQGLITLNGGFPAGSTFNQAVIDIIAGNGSRVRVNGTFAAPNGFTYSVVVPGGTYSIGAQLVLEFADGTAVNRNALRTVTVCGDTHADMLLEALPTLTSKSVTVTGLGVLSPAPENLQIDLESSDGRLLLFHTTGAISAGSATASGFDLPSGTLLPTIVATHSSRIVVTRSGGYQSYLRVATPMDTAAPTIALPEVVQLSGSVTDSSGQLVNPSDGGVSYEWFMHQIECQPADDNRFSETSTAYLFTDAPTFSMPVRKNVQCQLLPTLIVGMPVYRDTLLRENSVGSLFLKDSAAPSTTYTSTTSGIGFTVPNLGARFLVNAQLVDARGAGLSGYNVWAQSSDLSDGNLSSNIVQVYAGSDDTGSFDLHVISGTYSIIVEKQ